MARNPSSVLEVPEKKCIIILRLFSKFSFTSRVFCNPSIAVYLRHSIISALKTHFKCRPLPLQVSVVVTEGQVSISCQCSLHHLELDGLTARLVASLERGVAVESRGVILLGICWVGLEPKRLRVARMVPQIDDMVLQPGSDIIRFAENWKQNKNRNKNHQNNLF